MRRYAALKGAGIETVFCSLLVVYHVVVVKLSCCSSIVVRCSLLLIYHLYSVARPVVAALCNGQQAGRLNIYLPRSTVYLLFMVRQPFTGKSSEIIRKTGPLTLRVLLLRL